MDIYKWDENISGLGTHNIVYKNIISNNFKNKLF